VWWEECILCEGEGGRGEGGGERGVSCVGTFVDETKNRAAHLEEDVVIVIIDADFQRQGGDEERGRLHCVLVPLESTRVIPLSFASLRAWLCALRW
jgi:hypothetical protein